MARRSGDHTRGVGKKLSFTEEELYQAALGYLNRFDASVARLKRVLGERVRRALRRAATSDSGIEQPTIAEVRPRIDAVIERLVGAGLVNDQRYAGELVASLRSRGASTRKLRSKLMARGLTEEVSQRALALAASDPHGGGTEFEAALQFARRRKLGRSAPVAEMRALRQKELAKMARAGFDMDTAQKALNVVRADRANEEKDLADP